MSHEKLQKSLETVRSQMAEEGLLAPPPKAYTAKHVGAPYRSEFKNYGKWLNKREEQVRTAYAPPLHFRSKHPGTHAQSPHKAASAATPCCRS